MKIFSKLLSLVLAVVMLVGLLPTVSFAAAPAADDPAWQLIPAVEGTWENLTSLANGDAVRLVRNGNYLTATASGNNLATSSNPSDATIWTLAVDGSNVSFKAGSSYLKLAQNSVSTTADPTALAVSGRDGRWTIKTSVTGTGFSQANVPNNAKLSNYVNNGYYYKVAENDYRLVKGLSRFEFGGDANWTITYDGGSITVKTKKKDALTLWTSGLITKDYYLTQENNAAVVKDRSDPGSEWSIQKKGPDIPAYYAALAAEDQVFRVGTFNSIDALENELRSRIAVYTSSQADHSDAAPVSDYTLSRSKMISLNDNDSAVYTVSYDGHTLGSFTVTMKTKSVESVELDPYFGTVSRDAKGSANTGAKFIVTYDDGSVEEVPVKLQNIQDGTTLAKNVGEYTGLTVKYDDTNTFTGFTLNVTPNPNENDYPEYPDGGSVRVNKTGTGIDFTSTGVAKVELAATGVPVQKGIDVILMLDTSSSMGRDKDNNTTSDNSKKRITMLQNSLSEMFAEFKTPNEDGSYPDIEVSVASFNGFTQVTTGNAYNASAGDDYVGANNYAQPSTPAFFTGNGPNAASFKPVGDINVAALNQAIYNNMNSGTNYDYAFDTIYKLATAKQQANEAAGEDRDLYVIFMSDGATFQYNYFYSKNTQAIWGSWLDGSINMNSPNVHSTKHKYYFNEKGERAQKHRMAEAIKGSPDDTFEVIMPGSAQNQWVDGKEYMVEIPGLGATLYSIGFCITEDGSVPIDPISGVIYEVASEVDGERLYFDAADQNSLTESFTQISHNIRLAATNARFIDTMGPEYDLQMAGTVGSGNTVVNLSDKGITPAIEVKEYTLYKNADVNGTTVTEDMVGTRKGLLSTKEAVTFNADGSEAYSSKHGSTNILRNGVICADTFYYNTTADAVVVDGITVPAESFYWKIGTIGETELALSYYVYLTDSMEGNRDPGAYPTNTSAVLHYTNWLGHESELPTTSPVLAWGGATVSYGFYLVDENGNVLVNRTTGQTGSFANKIAIAAPRTYDNFHWNEEFGFGVSDVAVPEGYTLYDPSAAYSVEAYSDGGGFFTITDGTGKSSSTYVTGYNGGAYTTANTSDNRYDYTHTTVWFAVVFEINAMPDVVVIDYGLPVQINVLANDSFGKYGTLAALGSSNPTDGAIMTEDLPDTFAKTYAGTYGDASIQNSKVTYQVGSMTMDAPEKFYYAVNYNNSDDAEACGYYYSSVTVIPATTIYYEDTGFVNFDDNWSSIGTYMNGVQAEDRPGQTTISGIDANNLYGYDGAYENCTTYSMGSAMKTTVDADNRTAVADFTFTGTGFDLISVTSGDTGMITVNVYEVEDGVVSDTPVRNWAVDTYYGYTCEEAADSFVKYTWTYDANGKWHVVKEIVAENGTSESMPANPVEGSQFVEYAPNYVWSVTDRNALYQIPVIKGVGLDYGTYKVVVTATYMSLFDHPKDGAYDFYLDAVRIYDPAKNNSEATNAYKADDEAYPEYIELRNNLISAEDFNLDEKDEDVSGVVFIDGFGEIVNIEDLPKYSSFGPNNEVYLTPNQSVAFKLSSTNSANVASVQLSAKSLNGAGQITVKNVSANSAIISLTPATDRYYDISAQAKFDGSGKTDVIVVTNTGSNPISLTNIKVTYSAQKALSTMLRASVMMSRSAVTSAVDYLNTFYLASVPVEEVVEEEPEIITVFTPAKFAVDCGPAAIKVGDKVNVTIRASADVKNVTVNGFAAKAGKLDKKTGEITWTYSFKASEAGELPVEVIAYNADGAASEPFISVRNVTVKKTLVKKLFDAFRPGLK